MRVRTDVLGRVLFAWFIDHLRIGVSIVVCCTNLLVLLVQALTSWCDIKFDCMHECSILKTITFRVHCVFKFLARQQKMVKVFGFCELYVALKLLRYLILYLHILKGRDV